MCTRNRSNVLCARGRHAPQLFSETAQLGWVEEVKVRKEGLKWCRLQLTRPTVLLNEIIAFGWHLFTNSCTQRMKSLLSAGTFSPIAVLKIYLPKGQVVRAFSVVRPKIYLSRAIGRVGISSPGLPGRVGASSSSSWRSQSTRSRPLGR